MNDDIDLWDIVFGPDELLVGASTEALDADDDLLHVLEFFNTRAFPLEPERDTRPLLRRMMDRKGWL